MYEVKDSGERAHLGGGMVRDTEAGKADYTLILDGPMHDRWAAHMTKGASKYAARNWMLASQGTPDEIIATMRRFQRSAFRHFLAWMRDVRDEDHAAAVFFNLNGYEYLRDVLNEQSHG